jgi:ADP-dependent NAD(P)H-hydrate dehydratase / NAD(P)H-hydrate epimerase
MKIFSSEQVREIDAYTIEHEPIASIDLMERASKAFAFWFMRHFDISHKIVVFAGPGNNGGDALAIARLLYKSNYKVSAYLAKFTDSLSNDCKTNYERLKALPEAILHDLKEDDQLPVIQPGTIIIDGLFGSGLNRPVTGFPAKIIDFINHSSAKVVSIDIPSGLFGEDNRNNITEAIIRSDFTVTFQFPFLSFFFAENYKYTGEWIVVPIGLHKDIIANLDTDYNFLTKDFIRSKLKPRPKFSHKGTFGHALLITGSYGMMGAAVISAKACLRGGAGLVTAHVPSSGYQIMQTAVPEALLSIDKSDRIISDIPGLDNFTAIGIGPGISAEAGKGSILLELIKKIKVPLVIDADGLNSLSCHKEWYGELPENTILTPHPKEFDRLAGDSDSMYERHLKQIEFAKKYRVIIVLKGANTIITLPDGRSWFNTTGNPGMASGGSGDVLTGLIASLLAQAYEPADAAMLAVYIHGLAADIAVETISQPALIAGDVIEHIGKAFLFLNKKE